MEIHQLKFKDIQAPVSLVLERRISDENSVLVGTAQMKAGQRIPVSGESVHPADEYSFIVKGRVLVEVNGQQHEYGPGTFMLIPAGEGHVTTGLEDTEVVWWWAGQPRHFNDLKTQYPAQHFHSSEEAKT